MTIELINITPPHTWSELVNLRAQIPFATPQSTRLPDDLDFYTYYYQLVSPEIRLTILKRLIGDSPIKILRNNFPYTKLLLHLPEVNHYCLWSNIGPLSESQIESEIKNTFPGQDTLWFENIKETKSIPEIWHCHIFVKIK